MKENKVGHVDAMALQRMDIRDATAKAEVGTQVPLDEECYAFEGGDATRVIFARKGSRWSYNSSNHDGEILFSLPVEGNDRFERRRKIFGIGTPGIIQQEAAKRGLSAHKTEVDFDGVSERRMEFRKKQ